MDTAETAAADAGVMREAMLAAIGDLSDSERERLADLEQPDDVALAWRDLIAERAARERETTVRLELNREFENERRAAQQRPTGGLRGGSGPIRPGSVAEWTELIRSSDDPALRQRRRAQFADWLAAHPEA